ncbi:MAG: hypothetical protein KDC49_10170 [Saprospiraceae bacterium]|nr:hypothetical protein [Saprospiraceae bacterium]
MNSQTMRVLHRYLGFFLAGIMAVYALSGIVMIFRDTDFLKQETIMEKTLAPGLAGEALGREMRIREFKADREEGDLVFFKGGQYNKATGDAKWTTKQLPAGIEKLTKMHKATSKSPLFFLNIFFGISLLFFVISAFFMFAVKSPMFKKGIYYTIAGIVLTLIMLFV